MEENKMTSKELIAKLDIKINKSEFINDLNLFLDIMAFREKDTSYVNLIKEEFDDYMSKWPIDIEEDFAHILQYIKQNKLPFKIAKDEGIENIKSDKFLMTLLIELYAINIIIENDYISKSNLISLIEREFKLNKINITRKEIFIKDINYFFKDEKIYSICRKKAIKLKDELYKSFASIQREIGKKKNINLNLKFINRNKNDINEVQIINNLKIQLEEQKLLSNKYLDKQVQLEEEIEKLKKMNEMDLQEEIGHKIITDLLKRMNDETNGNLMDRLYRYSRGYEEKDLNILISNLFNVFREVGVSPREVIKIGTKVNIEEYSFYDYRINKDISDVDIIKGEVVYPAWYYKNKEVIKPYVNIEEE